MKKILSVICLTLLFSCSYKKKDVEYESSIQGMEASDKKNGVYDLSISDQRVETFVQALKLYTKLDDSVKLSTMITYPIYPIVNEKQVTISNQDEFIASYNDIFNPHLKEAIDKASAEHLYVNDHGFMLGDGHIWFAKSKHSRNLTVIDINNY